MDVFGFIPGYTEYIYDTGKEPMFAVFVSFLIAFGLTRGYTRMARRKGWGSGNVGGVHLHHVVPGIILSLTGGLLAFTTFSHDYEPLRTIAAIVFGVGAALVLDEFALIFHLKDVYWEAEGRSSVDATIIGVMLAGVFLVSSSPFEVDDTLEASDPRTVVFATLAAGLLLALTTFLKGKYFLGIAALVVPILGLVGSIRAAKPYSPFAHVFYEPSRARTDRSRRRRARKLEKAWRRYETGRFGRFERWFIDFVGGKPYERSAAESPEMLASYERTGAPIQSEPTNA